MLRSVYGVDLRSRTYDQLPRSVHECQVLVHEAYDHRPRIPDGFGGVTVAVHPIKGALRSKPSIEQIEHLAHLESGAFERDAGKRPYGPRVPAKALHRSSATRRRLSAHPERIGGDEALPGARRAGEAHHRGGGDRPPEGPRIWHQIG